jgi:mercuric ion binding protein
MKYLLLLITFFTFLFVGCGKHEQDVATTVIKTPSMVCGTCAKTIEKAVAGLDGITEVNADVKSKTVSVKFISSKINLESMEKAITSAGYDANDRKRNPEAYEKLDKCCKIDG